MKQLALSLLVAALMASPFMTRALELGGDPTLRALFAGPPPADGWQALWDASAPAAPTAWWATRPRPQAQAPAAPTEVGEIAPPLPLESAGDSPDQAPPPPIPKAFIGPPVQEPACPLPQPPRMPPGPPPPTPKAFIGPPVQEPGCPTFVNEPVRPTPKAFKGPPAQEP